MKPLAIHSQSDLTSHITTYQEKVDICRDAVNMLNGMTPDNFVFTFTIKGCPVITFEIGENEADVCLSYFTYMCQYYGRVLDQLKGMQPISKITS